LSRIKPFLGEDCKEVGMSGSIRADGREPTRGERMLALRKARMAASPPVLRGGFRPFFLACAVWALLALPIWLFALLGGFDLPSAMDPLTWHRHEMLFGCVGAAVAGFLLTAIPNWTGRLPIAGWPLAALALLWLAGRLAVLWSGALGPMLAATVDVALWLVLAFVGAREILAAKNRNLPLVAMVLLFGLANALDHAGANGVIGDGDLGMRAGTALVIMMISVIGGRIIPSFTRNWLAKQGHTAGLPGQPGRFDLAVILVTALALIGWIVAPSAQAVGALLVLAAILQLARLGRWRGWRTASDRLVLILHVGYLWIPIGLGLLGASLLALPIPRSAAIHALTAGGMATMILAVMTRATLGHTGRELTASTTTQLTYLLITLGAVIRVLAPLGVVGYRAGMEVAGALWIAAFVLFLAAYGPMLAGPRADKAPG
jgi:uncharacterized protein involved in response to NO